MPVSASSRLPLSSFPGDIGPKEQVLVSGEGRFLFLGGGIPLLSPINRSEKQALRDGVRDGDRREQDVWGRGCL